MKNLTDIIEKAEGEFDKEFCPRVRRPLGELHLSETHAKEVKSFLSEKIKEAYIEGIKAGDIESVIGEEDIKQIINQ